MDETPTPHDTEQPEWSGDELELMYQQAMEAVDSVEFEFGAPADVEHQADDEIVESGSVDGATEQAVRPHAPESPAQLDPFTAQSSGPRVTPGQVIEAILFVGGPPLTTKRLCSLLRDEFDREFVEEAIERLNRRYVGEDRPYEIRLGEGGYRLVLKEEFEPIRNRVFGLGPKEVKLSQESLEVLALVAYQQPIAKQKIEEEKPNCGAALRQLLRRELVSLERGETKDDVTYRSTDRFLEVFGLSSLEELPRAEELDFK